MFRSRRSARLSESEDRFARFLSKFWLDNASTVTDKNGVTVILFDVALEARQDSREGLVALLRRTKVAGGAEVGRVIHRFTADLDDPLRFLLANLGMTQLSGRIMLSWQKATARPVSRSARPSGPPAPGTQIVHVPFAAQVNGVSGECIQ